MQKKEDRKRNFPTFLTSPEKKSTDADAEKPAAAEKNVASENAFVGFHRFFSDRVFQEKSRKSERCYYVRYKLQCD